MPSTRRKYWTLFLTWLLVTPLACAVGMGVSAFMHRYIEITRGPNEGHILPLIIAMISTATFISLTFRIR
jgi:hypothetical protein